MLRSILAVVISYVAMVAIIIGAFMGLWLGMGPDRLLKPGSFQGNLFLNIAAPGITIVAGLFGGWLCTKIARSRKTAFALAAVVIALGGATAYFTMQKPFPADPRPEGMTLEQMMEKGREPTWLLLFNPIGGAVAVLIGGVALAKTPKAK